MTITIPSGRTLPLQAKAGGGFASTGAAVDITLPTANLAADTFETADMQPTLNNTGFTWANNNRTTIVTMDADNAWCTLSGPVAVWNNGQICNDGKLGQNWTPKNGTYSLRFRFPAIPGTSETLAEQRWSISTPQIDLWIRYWLRVPFNYVKATSGGSITNDKFLSVWKDTYDVAGTVTWQMRGDGSDGATLVYQDGGVTSGETGSVPFISVPADRGRWMQIVAHVLSATSDTALDGKIELWRRWENESAFTKLHEKLNADTWESGAASQGYQAGFIMGSHREYQEETDWLVDDFEMSDQPLVPAGTEGL